MDFAQEIYAHLQNLGPCVSAKAIVRFLDDPEMLSWRIYTEREQFR